VFVGSAFGIGTPSITGWFVTKITAPSPELCWYVALSSITREGVVGRRVLRELRNMSPEDQLEFDRWLKANAIVGSILAVGMLLMALGGSNSMRPTDAAAAVIPITFK
jgi:hypothetical protein